MRAKVILGVILLVVVSLVGYWYYHSAATRQLLGGVIANPAANLSGTNGRTNIALLGMGGDGHVGGDLTDSLILLSLNLSTRSATIIPIPRDIWVDSLQAKINTAYHYGEDRREGGGRDLVKSAISEITGQPVHYAVAIDFSGFVQAVDAVGGIDVNVENSFDDYKYPIPGRELAEPESSRYEHLHFDAGAAHFDGATALKFSRSRHAEGDEGTDFARNARQQKILLAFRDRVLSTSTLFNFQALDNLRQSINNSVDTDIGNDDYGSFLKIFLGMNREADVKSISLESLFVNPQSTRPYGGQWVLIPQNNWNDIHAYVAQNLAQ